MISTSRIFAIACAAAALSFSAGCHISARTWRISRRTGRSRPRNSFADGRSERPLVEKYRRARSIADDALVVPKDSNAFPLPVDWTLLERGEQRYNIFCSPCHGLQGDGNGMIAMRGVKRPPTYHQDRLRQSPNGYFLRRHHQMGSGRCIATPRNSPARPLAIIAYVRALQLSRNAKVAELPAGLREKLSQGGSSGPAGGDEHKPESGSAKETPGGGY